MKKPIDVYILSGQSNAVGYSFRREKVKTFKDVLIYNSCCLDNVDLAKWQELKNNMGKEKKRFGPEVGIAEILSPYYDINDSDAAFIKSGKGGEAIFDYFLSPTAYSNGIGDLNAACSYTVDGKEFLCGVGYYRLIKTISDGLKKLTEQGYEPNVVGLFWMQGETDAEKIQACAVYQTTLTLFLSDLKAFLNKPDLPIVLGKIKSPAPFEQEVIATQIKVASQTNNCVLVDTKDLKMQRKDNWHYDTSSMLELGKRFGVAMVTLKS